VKLPDSLLTELVKEVAGSDTIKVLDILRNKKNVSEFKIAEKLGLTVNQVRNMIYRMQEYNLVTFTRKKDKVKGWYIYYWSFDLPKATVLLVDRKGERVTSIKKELATIDTSRYYFCKLCRTKHNEEAALEIQFICEACGELLVEQDAQKRERELKKQLKKNEEDYALAKEALDYHRMLVARATDRRLAKEKAEKDAARKIARAKLAAEKAKLAPKKAVKKTTKKATKKKTKKAVKKKTAKKKPTKKAVKKPAKKKQVKKVTKKIAPAKKSPAKKKSILGRVFKKKR